MRFISTAKAELAAQRQKASELKSGMDIFNISQPAYKELTQNEKVPLQNLIRLSLVLVSRWFRVQGLGFNSLNPKYGCLPCLQTRTKHNGVKH